MEEFLFVAGIVLFIVLCNVITWLLSFEIGIFILFLLAGIVPSVIYLFVSRVSKKIKILVFLEMIVYGAIIFAWSFGDYNFSSSKYGNLWYLLISLIAFFSVAAAVSVSEENDSAGQPDWYLRYYYIFSMIVVSFLPALFGAVPDDRLFTNSLEWSSVFYLTIFPLITAAGYLLINYIFRNFFMLARGSVSWVFKTVKTFFLFIVSPLTSLQVVQNRREKIQSKKKKKRDSAVAAGSIIVNDEYRTELPLFIQGTGSLFISILVIYIFFFQNPFPFFKNRLITPSDEWSWFQKVSVIENDLQEFSINEVMPEKNTDKKNKKPRRFRTIVDPDILLKAVEGEIILDENDPEFELLSEKRKEQHRILRIKQGSGE